MFQGGPDEETVSKDPGTTVSPSGPDSAVQQPILVVEDTGSGRAVIQGIVRQAGYEVVEASTGEQALELFRWSQPGAVILEITLPGISGFEVCRHMRAEADELPILMLSRRSESEHKLRGFESGADDYLVKPFHPGELIARVRAILRRCFSPSRGALRWESIQLEPVSLKCRKGNVEIDLTPKEALLLAAFLRNPGRVLGRELLAREVWGAGHFCSAKGLDMHIRRLREKIEEDPSRPKHVRTAWGAGYVWR